MTTYTPTWRIPIMQSGDPAVRNNWGNILNAAFPLLEQGAVGNFPIPLTNTNGAYTLTLANDASDQARLAFYNFTGAITSPTTVTIPPVARIGWVSNGTSGGQNVTLTTGGTGTTLTVAPGLTYLWSCDGVNVQPVNIGVTGTLTAASGVTMNNGSFIDGKDTAGVARHVIGLGTDNYVSTFAQGLGWRVLNSAGTTPYLSVAAGGAVTIPGTLNAGATTVAALGATGITATTLTASGQVQAASTAISGNTSTASLTVSGTATLGTLNANGGTFSNTVTAPNVTVSGTVSAGAVSGSTVSGSTLNMSANGTVSGTLSVGGLSTGGSIGGGTITGTTVNATNSTIANLTSTTFNAATVNASGNLNVSGTATIGSSATIGGNLQVGTGSGGGGYYCRNGSTGGFGADVFNLYWNGTGMVLWLTTTNLGYISTSASDARYKTVVAPMAEGALDRIGLLKPLVYRWKDKGIFRDDGREREGMLAQSLLSVIPSAVEGDPEGEAPISINPVPIIATLIKAVQELTALGSARETRIMALTARVAALEAK